MTYKTWMIRCGILTVLVGLSACTKGDGDLRQWLAMVKNRPAPSLDPLPLTEDLPVVVYDPVGLRDPFSKPPLNRMSSNGGPSPDLNRRRQPLESYTLDSLSMVGSIGAGQSPVALVLAPNKVTYRVTPGMYLGQSDGRLVGTPSQDYLERIK